RGAPVSLLPHRLLKEGLRMSKNRISHPAVISSMRSTAMFTAAVLALPLALPPRSAFAQGDSCQTSLTVAVAQLTQCRAAAESSFAKSDNLGRRDAAFAHCEEQFDA